MTHATYAFLIPIDDPDADDETLAKEADGYSSTVSMIDSMKTIGTTKNALSCAMAG